MDNSARRSILIIQDNIDVADSLARFLQVGVGADVHVAYDGQSGFKAAVKHQPDVIVCDIALNGLELANALAAELKPKPLLLALTASRASTPRPRPAPPGSTTGANAADITRAEALLAEHEP